MKMENKFMEGLEEKLKEVFKIKPEVRIKLYDDPYKIINPLTIIGKVENGSEEKIIKIKKYRERVVEINKGPSGAREKVIADVLMKYSERLNIPKIYGVEIIPVNGEEYMAIYMEFFGKPLEEILNFTKDRENSIELLKISADILVRDTKKLTELYKKELENISRFNSKTIADYMKRDLNRIIQVDKEFRKNKNKTSTEIEFDSWMGKYYNIFSNWFEEIANQLGNKIEWVIFYDSLPKNILVKEKGNKYEIKINDFIKIGLSNPEISLARLLYTSPKFMELTQRENRDIINQLTEYAVNIIKNELKREESEFNIYTKMSYALEYALFGSMGILGWYLTKGMEKGRLDKEKNKDLIRSLIKGINERIDQICKLPAITGWDIFKTREKIYEGLQKLKIPGYDN